MDLNTFLPLSFTETNSLLERLANVEGYESWMSAWISYGKLSYHDGTTEITIVQCWHPDQSVFFCSSNLKDCVDAFTKYPYGG